MSVSSVAAAATASTSAVVRATAAKAPRKPSRLFRAPRYTFANPSSPSTTRAILPTRLAPHASKRLERDDLGLPIPHVDLRLREMAPSRLLEHYHSTVRDDVMYMTYKHEFSPRREPRPLRLKFDPADPYTKNRANPPVGGSQVGKKLAPPDAPENVVQLERVVVHTMQKEAIANRQNLLGAIMALRAITGETEGGGGQHLRTGVRVHKGVTATSHSWRGRNNPLAASVELRGQAMYDFLATLADFVFPRLPDFNGIVLPAPSANTRTPSGVSGVYEFGLPPHAMGLFPQIEVNLEAYPKMYGMTIHCITNATGQGARHKAAALLSGFQIPFLRR